MPLPSSWLMPSAVVALSTAAIAALRALATAPVCLALSAFVKVGSLAIASRTLAASLSRSALAASLRALTPSPGR